MWWGGEMRVAEEYGGNTGGGKWLSGSELKKILKVWGRYQGLCEEMFRITLQMMSVKVILLDSVP